jgi:flagellar protein FliT
VSALTQFHEVTSKLIEILEKRTGIDRDEKISLVEGLLEKREALVPEIVAPYTEEEKLLGAKIVELNKTLTRLLSIEKILIQKDIKDLTHKKESNNKYTNPYQSLETDGMFLDKKK